ncbi:hypothetical protein TNCV_1662371 [Trichonephila clavipes]|nr:hypothetical protein TNCV_1662371 [Trichonephila clavipes]
MHWRHRFPMLFIKLSGHRNRKRRLDTESLDQLAIPFVPNRDPQILLNNPSSVRSCIIIHQNEVVTNSSSMGGHMDQRVIRYLRPVTVHSMEHMRVSVATERPAPNQGFHHLYSFVSFNSVGLMVSSALFPPDQ